MPEVRKPGFLRNLRLTKVALVGEGANEHARISIFKAKEPVAKVKSCPECGRDNLEDDAMACPDCGYNFDKGAPAPTDKQPARKGKHDEPAPKTESTRKEEDMPENKKPEDGNEPTLEQRVQSLEDDVKAKDEMIKAKDAEIESLKKSKESDEPEDVLKGITDPEVRKHVEALQKAREADAERIEKAEEEIRKQREAEADRAATEHVAKFTSHLGVEKDKLGPALRKVREADKDAADLIEQTLTAANEAVETASLYSEFGKSAADSDSAEGKLEGLAKSYAKENNVGEAEAMAKVLETEEGAELYRKSLTEIGGRS